MATPMSARRDDTIDTRYVIAAAPDRTHQGSSA
jgi:hypothetical protein